MDRTSANRRGNTRAQHSFSVIPKAEIQRSAFDRSCGLKTTFDAGYLIPIFLDEALPGDTMNLQTHSLVRMATPLRPLMDNLYLDVFYFAVPIRLVWDNFQKMMGEQIDPGDSTDFIVPTMTQTVTPLILSDYMGIPIGFSLEFSSLWHRAYNLIWNEWFRDQNLQDSVTVDRDDGPDTPGDYVLLRRGKRHDYFTSSLPFAQKGDPVSLPLGTSAPITGTGAPTFDVSTLTGATLGSTNAFARAEWSAVAGSTDATAVWNNPNLTVNLAAATSATINQLREAFQIQKLLERDARGGTRYVEVVLSHFGVSSDDARLQRPEYLGGGSTRINIHPVANTNFGANPAASTPNATLSAFGVAAINGMGFSKSFTEHCVILGMCNVRADLTYQQGLNRMFSRSTRYDFFWPALAHIGEQAVLSKEIYADGTGSEAAGTGDWSVWGYQERYAEYRYKPSTVTGRMRSDSVTPIDIWHLAMDFASRPLLNEVFIEDNPPIARVVAAVTEPHFFGDFWFSFRHARPMPTFGVPGLIDHF